MQFAEEEGQSSASPANKKHATWIHDPVPRSQSKFLWMKRYETGEPSKLSSKNERLCRIMHNNSMKSKPFPQNGTLLQKRESSPFKRFYMGFDVSLWMVLLYLTSHGLKPKPYTGLFRNSGYLLESYENSVYLRGSSCLEAPIPESPNPSVLRAVPAVSQRLHGA